MKDSSFGIPVIRDTPFYGGVHQPSTVEVTAPHPLLKPEGSDYGSTKIQYVTVFGYNSEGERVGWHHVPQLPGRLGNTATQLVASAWVARLSLKV